MSTLVLWQVALLGACRPSVFFSWRRHFLTLLRFPTTSSRISYDSQDDTISCHFSSVPTSNTRTIDRRFCRHPLPSRTRRGSTHFTFALDASSHVRGAGLCYGRAVSRYVYSGKQRGPRSPAKSESPLRFVGTGGTLQAWFERLGAPYRGARAYEESEMCRYGPSLFFLSSRLRTDYRNERLCAASPMIPISCSALSSEHRSSRTIL
jgi:hypothetical protein